MDWARDPLEPNHDSPEVAPTETAPETMADPHWVPIVDYAVRHGMSTSTIRRYIKANKIRHKLQEGRYLIYSDVLETVPVGMSETETLKKQLAKAHEQIDELKMLVALYEEKLFSKNN